MKLFGWKKPDKPFQREQPLVLIIDDEQDLTSILRLVLTERKYQVETAGNGQRGLDLIRRLKPDLVLLDIMMPEMDGYQVLAILQQDSALAAIPVIVMTSVVEDKTRSDKEWAKSMEVCRFISKPFEPDALADEVDSLLRPHADAE